MPTRKRKKPSQQINRRSDRESSRKRRGADTQASNAIEIHFVTGDGWLHTHGMEALGLPELEARHIPGFLCQQAARLLREICNYMIESGTRIRTGEKMAVTDQTRLQFIQAQPVPGNEDHYTAERLLVADIGATCDCCRLRPSDQN